MAIPLLPYDNHSLHTLLSIPSHYASSLPYFITARYLWLTIILIWNHCITQKQLVDMPTNHLMKWHDWCEYPPSYNNCSYGNYRPCLLRLLLCQGLKKMLPHTYSSVWWLSPRNPQLNSACWSTHHSIRPYGFSPKTATSMTCCYFRRPRTICSLRFY